MKITTTHWWIIGGAVLIGTGAAVWFFRSGKKDKADPSGLPASNRKHRDNALPKGVRTTTTGKAVPLTEPDWNRPFDMNFEQEVKRFLAPRKILVLADAQAKAYAGELYRAKGKYWYSNDNESAVKAVFAKKLKDKVQVAGLSRAFWNRYKKDMWEYLSSFLSAKEMEIHVHTPVRKLPNYRLA